MRLIEHHEATELPPPMPGPMSRDDVWQAVEAMTRLLGEAQRREMPADLYGKLDVARAVALGMYSTTLDRPGVAI